MTSTLRITLVVAAALASSGASYGCQPSREADKSAGTEPQREANDKLTEARDKAEIKITEAHQDVAKATDEAHQATAQAQANANDKVREENRAVADTHDETRKWAQEKMDDVDHRIDAARTKAQTAAPTAKAHFNEAIQGVKQDRDALQAEMSALETRTGEKLDKSKVEFTERADRIKTNIDNLETSR